MIHFFGNHQSRIIAVQSRNKLSRENTSKLAWLFSCSKLVSNNTNKPLASIDAFFIGPRASMISPWSTNAVEITQNMGIEGIIRIEEFKVVSENFSEYDPMIYQKFNGLNQDTFTINIEPEPILEIDNIGSFNKKEGLALSDEEINYLNDLASFCRLCFLQ